MSWWRASHKQRAKWLWLLLPAVALAGGASFFYLDRLNSADSSHGIERTNSAIAAEPDSEAAEDPLGSSDAESLQQVISDLESVLAQEAPTSAADAVLNSPEAGARLLNVPTPSPSDLPARNDRGRLPPFAERLIANDDNGSVEADAVPQSGLTDSQSLPARTETDTNLAVEPGEVTQAPEQRVSTVLAAQEPTVEPSADTPADQTTPAAPAAPASSAVPPGFESLAGVPPGFENLAGVPPGFESFLMEQTTVVDVFYGGRLIYSGLATFDQMFINFANPAELAESIPGLIDVQPVLLALSEPMPLNENLRCLRAQQTNCGVMFPEIADVIFDSQSYRADLFVNADLLSLQAVQVQPYLGPSSAGFSVFQTLNFAATGSDSSSELTSSFNGRTLVSFGETFARMTSNWSEERGLEIDNLNLQRDWEGMRYQAGLVTPGEDLRFAQSQTLVGISAGSSLDTREDLRFTTGNTLEVFLPLRSRVSIFKDDRLISSTLYEAGNHQLDTSVLPGGSYQVEIRIEDANGTRSETRFYTKSSRLPPAGSPQMSASLGLLEDPNSDNPLATSDTMLWRASYASRLGDASAVRVGGSGTQTQQVLELGWFHTRPGVQLEANGAMSNRSDAAISLGATGVFGPFSYSARYRRIWDDAAIVVEGPDLIGAASQQANASVNFPLLGGSLSLSGRYSEQVTDTTRTLTANYRFQPIDLPFGRIAPGLQLGQQNGLYSALFTLSFRESRDQWQFTQQSQYSRNELDDGTVQTATPLDAGVRWRSPDDWRSLMQAGAAIRRPDADSRNLTADLNWATGYGRLQAQASSTSNSGVDTNSWSMRANTSLVYAGGTVAFGGRQQQQSAVLVDLRDLEMDDAYFAVMVNDREAATLNPGTAALVPLTPYAEYQIRLESRGLAFAAIESRDERITLYPGNAVKLSWEVEQINIVFGRLTDLEGNPVANAVIHGVQGLAVTDDSGFFQAELPTRAEELRAETIDSECVFAVPEYSVNRTVGRLGTIQCELTPK